MKNKTYISNMPCPRDYSLERFEKSGTCVECWKRSKAKKSQTPRILARQEGATTYRTEKPCKNGHVSDRYVSTGNCVECSKPAQSDHAPLILRPHPDDRQTLIELAEMLRAARS